MNYIELFDAIEFHDGVICDLIIKCNKESQAKLLLELYVGNTSVREKKEIKFQNINNVNVNLDMNELSDNHSAGNISYGYIKEHEIKGRYKFFIYFTDGMIYFDFEKVSVT